MGIKDILEKLRSRKKEYNDMKFQDAAVNKIQSRKKTLNEAELDYYKERDRQERIKRDLQRYRKRDSDKFYSKGKQLNTPYMFKSKKNIMNSKYAFHNSSGLLGQRSVFMRWDINY